jgi:hypothetical protein
MFLIFATNLHRPLWAQSADTGAIFGSITDKSGAVVPGASVSVTNTATGSLKTVTTNPGGFYAAEALASGDYKISVAKQGFATVDVNSIHIDPGQRREVSTALAVGATTEIVNVEANALEVKTETSDVSSTIGSEEIQTLLVNGRNFQSLATLVPGVNNTTGNSQYQGGGLTSSTSISIGGTGVDNTTYLVDGVYNMNTGNYVNINITPSMDAISEFTVLKSNYSSRYGTSSSGVVLVNTKSGTSTYHGTVWDYLRNDAVDASTYYSINGQKSALHQNIYGYSLGGPLQIPTLYNWDRKKQTFFFASDEWWSKTIGSSATGTVVTSAERGGDFTAKNGLLPHGVPATGLSLSPAGQAYLAAEGKTNCISSAFTLNPACLDNNALLIAKTYQATENAAPSNGQYNYLNDRPDTFSQIDHDYRIDHSFTPNETLMGRVMYEQTNSFSPEASWGGGHEPNITTSIFTSGLNAVLRLTSILTPSIVNTVSAAETYDKPRLHTSPVPLPGGVVINQYYPKANVLNMIPNIDISGYDSINGAGQALPINASDGEGILDDDVAITHGKNSVQFGGFYIFGIKNQNVFTQPNGSFTFDGFFTGSSAADYLLGLHHGYSQFSSKPHYTPHYRQIETYIQDDVKVNRRLTLNLGARFFYYSPDWLTQPNGALLETSDFYFSNFDPSQAPVVNPDGSLVTNASGVAVTAAGTPANLQNGLVYDTDATTPRGFYNSKRVYIGPRVGFAYALTGDGRTSFHAGYGIGYVRIPFQIYNTFAQNPPGVASVNFTQGTFENPTGGAALTVAAPRPQPLTLTNPKFHPNEVQSFSAIVEREVVRGSVLQAGYVGSLSRKGQVAIDSNQPFPTSTPYANCGQAPAAVYDYDPCINSGQISEDYVRPYQGWEGLNGPVYEGNDHYNSFQSQFKYQRKAVQTTINYTWGHAYGDTSQNGTNFVEANSNVQNSRCLSCENGTINFDRTHIFTGNVIYNLPFYANGPNSLLKNLAGGWAVSGIALAQSGFALTPTLSSPNSGLANRPNVDGSIKILGKRNQWFDASNFSVPGYGFFGNGKRGTIRGPKEVAFNVELNKTFDITERMKFLFQAQAFNIANHPSFTNVDTGFGPNDSNTGIVNSPNDQRIMEFVGRITF